LSREARDYNALFDKVLAVLGDSFQIDYANRFDGRIETFPLPGEPEPLRLTAPGLLEIGPAVWRRAVVEIRARPDGGFWLSLRVLKVSERKSSQDNHKVASHTKEAAWQVVGRDDLLEQKLLRQMAGQPLPAGHGIRQPTPKSAEEMRKMADFYQATGHPATADFYCALADKRTKNRQEKPIPDQGDLAWDRLGLKLVPIGPEAVAQVRPKLHGGMKILAIRPTLPSFSGKAPQPSPAAQTLLRTGDVLIGLHQWEALNRDNVAYALGYCQGASLGTVRYVAVRNNQLLQGVFNLSREEENSGVGLNSSAGLTGSIRLNERNFDLGFPIQSPRR
jgi:hypothetical protein